MSPIFHLQCFSIVARTFNFQRFHGQRGPRLESVSTVTRSHLPTPHTPAPVEPPQGYPVIPLLFSLVHRPISAVFSQLLLLLTTTSQPTL